MPLICIAFVVVNLFTTSNTGQSNTGAMLMPAIQRLSHATPIINSSPTSSSSNGNGGNTSSTTITSGAMASGAASVSSNVLPHIIIQSQTPQQLLHSGPGRPSPTNTGGMMASPVNPTACLTTALPSALHHHHHQQLKQNIITVHAITPNAAAPNVNSSPMPGTSSAASLTLSSLSLANNSQYNYSMGQAGQQCLYTTSNMDLLQGNQGNSPLLNQQSLTQVQLSPVMPSSAGVPMTVHSSQNSSILEYLESNAKM